VTLSEQAKEIRDNGYVHIPDLIDAESARELTDQLKTIVASGKTQRDDQCPLSEAVHGHPVFDSLLEQLLPSMQTITGKRLHPTYAYARMYVPGETLAVHTDREACEYSLTLTLGNEGKPWPIFMAKPGEDGSSVTMHPGGAVAYRGCDMLHWREAFEGEWQAQVFLHYVDADGPNAEWKFDKRHSLSHHAQPEKIGGPFRSFPGVFSAASCAGAIATVEANYIKEAGGLGPSGEINLDIRDVTRFPMPVDKGITAALVGLGLQCNFDHYKFDITRANQSEMLRYDSRGHYTSHIDTFLSPSDAEVRKLTVLLFLNDDFEGGRLFIQDGHERMYPPQKAGDVVIFPSFLLHGVEPVTSGVRRSLVTWMVGPWFR
jgi:hypothetical protein